MSESLTLSSPYKGLTPYREEDAMLFFGREIEQEIIIANLRAYPLTVLYGQSGVGKTSVLRAGVAHRLHKIAVKNITERSVPELAVAIVNSWRDDPLGEVRQRVREAVEKVCPEALAEPVPNKLDETLSTWANRIGGPILIILDQFEEYFLYWADDDEDAFAVEFPQIAMSSEVPANFLIAMREDALARLDRFKTRLPNIFDNNIPIRHLDRDSARCAITGPLNKYNQQRPPSEHVSIEPELIEAVLDDLRSGHVALGPRGQGLTRPDLENDEKSAVETPYLQLVMRRVWDTEMANGSRALRLATLTEQLHGANHIVRTHLDISMDTLPLEDQRIAGKVFQYLVTPSGTKIAHIVPDLSLYADVSEDALTSTLAKLDELRILRRVPPASHQGNVLCYEIFHDVLAPAILDWRGRYAEKERREELARQLQEQRAEALRWKSATDAAERAHAEAERQRRLALSNELAAHATSQLRIDPELSVLLAIEAVETSATPLAQDALRQSLLECRIRAVMRDHLGHVSSAAFSPDGQRIVTASQDGTARLWHATTGAALAALRGHTKWVWSAVFSPDGQRIVTASNDRTAGIWDGRTGQLIAELAGHTDRVRSAVFSPDGAWIVTGGYDCEARVWDGQTYRELAVLRGHSDWIRSVTVSPDSRLVATAGKDGAAVVWNLADGRHLSRLEGHTDQVWSAMFSPDSTSVLTASFDQTARIWDAQTGRMLAQLRHTHSVLSAAFSPDGRWVLTASLDNTAEVRESDTGRTVARFYGHSGGVISAAFSPDGKLAVTASQDRTARLWEIDTSHISLELRGHRRAVMNVAFSPDGAKLVTASGDETARVWDVGTGRTVLRLVGHDREVSGAVFSPDGELIVTSSWDWTAMIWSARTGKLVRALAGHEREVSSAAFSPDGMKVVTGSRDRTARVWAVDTGATLLVLEGHEGAVANVAFSPDGALIATAGADQTARLWDAKTGRPAAELPGHTGALWTVAFSPDGRSVVTASDDRTARIWDVSTTSVLAEFRGHMGRVNGAAFSPDGAVVITASEDRTACVWEVATGSMLTELRGHADQVFSAAVSVDGDWIATGSSDGVARIYRRDVQSSVEDLLARARERVTRELTLEERAKYLLEPRRHAGSELLPSMPEEIISG